MTALEINLYSDGSCIPNPGLGGWACILKWNEVIKIFAGFEEQSTNNRMELTAIIEGLKALNKSCIVNITTDSQYVKNAFTQNWLKNWKNKNWKTADGSSVKNIDLWLQLDEISSKHSIKWFWIKGHSGHKYNELCDKYAKKALKERKKIEEKLT